MVNKIKKIPKFKNENEERLFWSKNDSVDWSKAKRGAVFPNLKLSTKTIALRLPENLLNEMKRKANTLDIPYQSYIPLLCWFIQLRGSYTHWVYTPLMLVYPA